MSDEEHCKDCHILSETVEQLEKRIYERFAAEKELREKLEVAVNGRLEGMNEFRHQLDKQAATFVTWGGLMAALLAAMMLGIAATTMIVGLITGKL